MVINNLLKLYQGSCMIKKHHVGSAYFSIQQSTEGKKRDIHLILSAAPTLK